MQDIVSLTQVKTHLGLQTFTDHDDDLTMKLEEAEALVLDYVRQRVGTTDEQADRYAVIDAWDDESAPLQVRAAILRMVTHLFRWKGDDERTITPQLEHGDLPADVTSLLKRLRDPALA